MYDEQPGERGQLDHFLEKLESRKQDLLAKQRDINKTLEELETVAASCRESLKQMQQAEKM